MSVHIKNEETFIITEAPPPHILFRLVKFTSKFRFQKLKNLTDNPIGVQCVPQNIAKGGIFVAKENKGVSRGTDD